MRGRENRGMQGPRSLDLVDIRRNPYLVEYEEQRQSRRAVNGSCRSAGGRARRRSRNSAAAKKAARRRRKRKLRRQRMMAAACLLCLFMIGLLISVKAKDAFAAESADNTDEIWEIEGEEDGGLSTVIQGLPSKVFAKHPTWEENFLPLNGSFTQETYDSLISLLA